MLATFIHLQSKKIVTAKELAQRFNVSIRTVYRDIRSLETAGIPIGSETGKGYFLVEGFFLSPIKFTQEELGALILTQKTATTFLDNKTQDNLLSAIFKIKSGLLERDKEQITESEDKIMAFSSANNGIPGKDVVYNLQTVLHNKKIVKILYQASDKDQITSRQVEPVSLFFSEYHWYMVAYCHLRNAYRIFRADRIKDIQITEKDFRIVHPSVETILKEILSSKPTQPASLLFKMDNRYMNIRDRLAPGIINEEIAGDKIKISLVTDSLPVLGKWLLESACEVEVLHPPELKTILHQNVMNFINKYRDYL